MVYTQFRSDITHTHKGFQGWPNRERNQKGGGGGDTGLQSTSTGSQGRVWVHTSIGSDYYDKYDIMVSFRLLMLINTISSIQHNV